MTKKRDDSQDKTLMMDDEEITEEYRTEMLKTMFPGRTDAELVKINRNFLRDAEPFELERLINEVKKGPDSLLSGFKQLDALTCIPGGALTLVAGNRKQGKSLFMMNMMFNMTRMYKNKHFLYYSYEESKKDIVLKLINLAGDTVFEPDEYKNDQLGDLPNPCNLDVWQSKLKTLSEPELLKMASERASYRGLMNFLDVSGRIHIIDSCYPVSELIESVKLFNGPFLVGAVFVDFIQKIETGGNGRHDRSHNAPAVSHDLRKFISERTYPMIAGSRYRAHGRTTEEGLPADPVSNPGEAEYDADLIIDLQQEREGEIDFLNIRAMGNRVGPGARCRLKFIRPLLKIEDSAS